MMTVKRYRSRVLVGKLPLLILLTFITTLISCKDESDLKPNVIIVMTDDQGIGDLSCHGNPYLKTPNLDAFYKESVSLTDFHVSPLCTPTRSAIITGKYPIRNGAWATFKGRDMITHNSPTIADIFKENGYATAIFGKWHLGDNYPARPTDCGFDYAVHHSSGGVGELSDYWGNNYFDDTYLVNNEPTQFEGYCTDVWFDKTIKYIERTKDRPFFIYLPTNAPHSPLVVADEYKAPYMEMEGKKIQSAAYLGMIANIDENFGRLDSYLKSTGLADNTILIFMTDNGTQYGFNLEKNWGFNKGFRGNKSNKEEGGHRVPLLIRWPNGGIIGQKEMDMLTAHVDLIPTLAGLAGLDLPESIALDGIDFSTQLLYERVVRNPRTVFIHHRQDWRAPDDVQGSCIMKDNWRLINGNELYNVAVDPMQLTNVIGKNQGVTEALLAENEVFIAETKQLEEYRNLPVSIVGTPHQEEITLTIQHAMGEGGGIWKSEHIAAGVKNVNNQYAIKFAQAGKYKISCRRWPKECPGPIHGVPKSNPKNQFTYQTITPEKVRIKIFDQVLESTVFVEDESVDFVVELPAGKAILQTDFVEAETEYGVYYTYIRKMEGD